MGDIEKIFTIDYQGLFVNIFIIIFAIVAMATVLDKFCKIIGKPIKWFKGKNDDHELLLKTSQNLILLQEKSEKDDRALEVAFEVFIDEVRESFEQVHKEFEDTNEAQLKRKGQSLEIQQELNNKIDAICNVLEEMQKNTDERFAQSEAKTNKRVQSDIKERIAQSYRRYDKSKEISRMELEALEDLIDTYESFGGENSFVHSIVQKEMYTWEVIE